MSMRGLKVFIKDLRNCKTDEEEQKRVNKELANIRANFKSMTLNGYNRKKYISKLIFLSLAGYDIDFGERETVELLRSKKYSEKRMGYLSLSMILGNKGKYQRETKDAIEADLESGKDMDICLGLGAISIYNDLSFLTKVTPMIYKIITEHKDGLESSVTKKAILCLTKIIRENPKLIKSREWCGSLIECIRSSDLGVATSAGSLVSVLAQHKPEWCDRAVELILRKLEGLVIGVENEFDGIYYSIVAPWLQIKLFKVLGYLEIPDNESLQKRLSKVIELVYKQAHDSNKNYQFRNARDAVILEGINVTIHNKADKRMVKLSSKILGSFITHGNANSRYLGLDTMGYLALKHPGLRVFDKLKDKIFLFLRDRDESIQRRALDLLFSLCTLETAKEIVEELMGRLDTGKRGFRVELVTKIAVLTERFATEYTWYVDVMFRLIDEAGDSIDKDLVNRVIQVILANEELQLHAARLSFQYLSLSLKNTTNAKIIYVYLLGELGSIISEECPPSQQVDVVKQATKFYSPGNGGASLSSNASESEKDNFRAISATYFAKAAANFPNLYDECISGLLVCGETNSVEVQTRVGEYMALINTKDSVLISSVFEKVPPAPDSKSTLISRLTTKKKSRVGDRRTWIPGEHVFNLESAQPNSWAAILEPTIAIRSAHTTSPVTFHPNFDFSTFLLNFNTLLSTKAGVLFSNDFIDLTFKATLESCSISLLLSFTNKSNESLLEFSAAIDTTAPKALSLTTPVDLPQSACLYPNSPINLSFVLECCGFYVPAPILRFKYLATSLDSYSDFSLPLPILFLSFNEPVSLSAPDFQTRWSQLDATSYESSTVFKPRLNSKQLSTSKSSHSAANLKESAATISSPLFEPRNTTTPEETGSEFIHFAKSTISSLGFHLVSSSIDTNIDAVSIFSTSSSGKFGCLLRLNYSSNFCSFTVRSTYPDLSKNVMHTIKGLFS